MEQETINQRLKFLVEKLNLSSRAFSELIGESPTNTHNYIGSRQAEPRAGYLIKVLSHFKNVSPIWLMLGKGDPFFTLPNENTLSIPNEQKIFRSQVVGSSYGPNNQQQHNASASGQDPELKNKLTLAEKEIEHLRTLLAAKNETISLLKTAISKS